MTTALRMRWPLSTAAACSAMSAAAAGSGGSGRSYRNVTLIVPRGPPNPTITRLRPGWNPIRRGMTDSRPAIVLTRTRTRGSWARIRRGPDRAACEAEPERGVRDGRAGGLGPLGFPATGRELAGGGRSPAGVLLMPPAWPAPLTLNGEAGAAGCGQRHLSTSAETRLTRRPSRSGDLLGEEHPPEAMLPAAAGLGVPVPGVVGNVLGHRLVGVEPDLAEAGRGSPLFRMPEQPGPDPAALRSGQHRNVLQQQVIAVRAEDEQADDGALPAGDP